MTGRDAINQYFELSTQIESGKRDRDFPRAIRAARATYAILPAVVRQMKREYGSFDVVTCHAFDTAPRLMAVMEDGEAIGELRTVLQSVPELQDWLGAAEEAAADLEMVGQILRTIDAEPGVLQSSLKNRLSLATGSQASTLAAWLDKAGRIQRVKKGSTYQLYPAGYQIPTSTSPPSPYSPSRASSSSLSTASKTALSSSTSSSTSTSVTVAGRALREWKRRPAAKASLLDLSNLPVVRLPKAPEGWEEQEQEEQEGKAGSDARKRGTASRRPTFEVDGDGWALTSEEKLAPAERPDPAYREVFPTRRYTHWLDPKGRREGFEYAPSVLRVTDRNGEVVAERGLAHDVYRSDVNAEGTGILFLSRAGKLHGYTESLEPFIEESLAELPEYRAQAERFGIEPHELKNHTRTVAISSDRRRYLVTVVDEAWCLDTITGQVVWGVRMPTKEGWTRTVAERSSCAGSSPEVEAALRLMELELPVTPEDIVRQYRLLAARWHPDRNPVDPMATARFQDLGGAMELLTGADLTSLSGSELEHVTYEQLLATTRLTVPDGAGGLHEMNLTFSMWVGERFASDWIYAADFGEGDCAFLAGHSGKVVALSPHGVPERVYDIASVPRHIVDTGEHLYILTYNRLYVLAGDRLEALVDVHGASDVVVGDSGFALLEPKALTWYTPEGRPVGTVRSKHPIRRVLSTSAGLVVETRQHRALIAGAASWWQ